MTASEQKQLLADELWLQYYNQTLFEKGLIDESIRNRMKRIINSRSASAKAVPRGKTTHTR